MGVCLFSWYTSGPGIPITLDLEEVKAFYDMRDKIVRRLTSWQWSGVVSQQRLRLGRSTLVKRVQKFRFEPILFLFLACFPFTVKPPHPFPNWHDEIISFVCGKGEFQRALVIVATMKLLQFLRRPKIKNMGYSSDLQSKVFKTQTQHIFFHEIISCRSRHFRHLS